MKRVITIMATASKVADRDSAAARDRPEVDPTHLGQVDRPVADRDDRIADGVRRRGRFADRPQNEPATRVVEERVHDREQQQCRDHE